VKIYKYLYKIFKKKLPTISEISDFRSAISESRLRYNNYMKNFIGK